MTKPPTRTRSKKRRKYQKKLSLYPMSFEQAIDTVLRTGRVGKKLRDRSEGEHSVIGTTGQRTVVDRHRLKGSLIEVGGRCRLRYQAQVIKIEAGQEKVYKLGYGAEPVRLPGREEKLWLVVVAGFGQEPLLLLTNLNVARDSESLWWIAQIGSAV